MDPSRFDVFTKRLATRGASRRTLLKGLLGSVAAGVTGAVVHEQANAFICRQGGVLCAKDAQCCSNSCLNYHCTCETGEVACGPRCCAADQVCIDPTHGQCCTPTTCAAYPNQCGSLSDGCGGTLSCACASGCCGGGTCQLGTADTACGTGGTTCQDCTQGGAQSGGVCNPFTSACCLTAGTCCADVATCAGECCAGHAGPGPSCASGQACGQNLCGGPCATDNDCGPDEGSCVGGICTCPSGTVCSNGACR